MRRSGVSGALPRTWCRPSEAGGAVSVSSSALTASLALRPGLHVVFWRLSVTDDRSGVFIFIAASAMRNGMSCLVCVALRYWLG